MLIIPNSVSHSIATLIAVEARLFDKVHSSTCNGKLLGANMITNKITLTKIFCSSCKEQFVVIVHNTKPMPDLAGYYEP